MTALRIGVVGLGKIAIDQHLPAIEGDDRFVLAATVDRKAVSSPTTFTSTEAMLAGAQLDAVAICTPPGPRYDIARACIDAGLHVLLEKPPTATLAEVEDLDQRARQRGVSLFATWHAQHNPAVIEAARLLAGKRVRSMAIVWHEDVEKWHPGQQWIWKAGGFGVFDPGINAFSIVSAIFPASLLVREAALSFEGTADTPFAAEIRFASPQSEGALECSLNFRHTNGEDWSIAVETEDGLAIKLLDGGAKLVVDGAPRTAAGIGEYPDIYRRFAELIDRRAREVDVVPLRMVADCLLVASRQVVGDGSAGG